jgi:acyl carrier protein
MDRAMLLIEISEMLEKYGVILNPEKDANADIFDYGLDSLGYVMLISELEARFQINVDDQYLLIGPTNTLSHIVDIVFASMR